VGGMPYALKEAGFYGGMLLILTVACCSDYTVRKIVALGVRAKRKYYEDLCASQFGHGGYVFVVGAMGIFAYGAMVAYLMGIGDNMSIVVASWSGTDLHANPWIKRVTLVSISIGAVLPLAMLRNMSALSKTSLLSICSVFFIIGVVLKNAIYGAGDAPVPVKEADKALLFIDSNFFPAVGVIAFAFVCHHATFIVYNTLRDNTEKRWNTTVHATIGVATSVMFVLAVGAFWTFRGLTKGSFLTNYSYTDPLCNIMRCLFAITQTLTYPLELFVARHATHALIFPAQKWTNEQHYTITMLLWGSSLAIALNVTDLGAVLELTGGVAAVSIGFIMPGLLHFKMHPTLDVRCWRNKPGKRFAACYEFGFSVFVMVLGALAMFFVVVTMGGHIMSEGAGHDALDPHNVDSHSGGSVEIGEGGWGWGRRA
jgi:sodium-coupled neutral amino acid transporter 11